MTPALSPAHHPSLFKIAVHPLSIHPRGGPLRGPRSSTLFLARVLSHTHTHTYIFIRPRIDVFRFFSPTHTCTHTQTQTHRHRSTHTETLTHTHLRIQAVTHNVPIIDQCGVIQYNIPISIWPYSNLPIPNHPRVHFVYKV